MGQKALALGQKALFRGNFEISVMTDEFNLRRVASRLAFLSLAKICRFTCCGGGGCGTSSGFVDIGHGCRVAADCTVCSTVAAAAACGRR